MQRKAGTTWIFSAWLGMVVIFSLAVALCVAPRPALAIDPECDHEQIPPMPTDIDATSGSLTFCSPTLDATGAEYPKIGYPLTCFIEIDGELKYQSDPIGPGVVFTYNDTSLRFEHDVQAFCSNDPEGEGDGLALQPVPARFPAAAPGRPHLVPPA